VILKIVSKILNVCGIIYAQINMKEKKVCFILPYFDLNASSNALHILSLVEHAAKDIIIDLYIEKSTSKPEVKNINHIWQENSNFLIFKVLKRFSLFLFLRMKGYKYFYVQGSYFSSMIASFICFFTHGKSYYWHCEKFVNYGKDVEKGLFNFLKWKFFHDLTLRLTLRLVNFLVTGSESIKKEYCKLFKIKNSKVKIVPNSIDLEKFKTESSKTECRKKLLIPINKKVILFVHWLSPRKGADLLPEIIKNVVIKRNDVLFLIVGSGPLKNHIKDKIKKNGNTKFILMSNEVQNSKMPIYYKASDVFILPSRQEGFPRVLIEAMACGTPFISTDVGGIPDIISSAQKKFMVKSNDVKIFSEKILNFLNSRNEDRDVLINEGKKIVQNYKIENVKKQFLSLFD